jgi:hypothetical protein
VMYVLKNGSLPSPSWCSMLMFPKRFSYQNFEGNPCIPIIATFLPPHSLLHGECNQSSLYRVATIHLSSFTFYATCTCLPKFYQW